MKARIEKFLMGNEDIENNKNFFLISGNEETLISSISEKIINLLNKNGIKEVVKKYSEEVNKNQIEQSSISLFESTKILVFYQPKKIDLEVFESQYDNLFIIVQDSRIKNNSEIKKWFDKSPNAYAVSCYKLNPELKKNLLSLHISKNNIKINKSSFWYFLENTDDRYGIFESELNKLELHENSSLSEKNIKELLASSYSDEVEKIFFLISGPNNKIITETTKSINSVEMAYKVIFQTKIFLNILLQSSNLTDINMYFPKHLFAHKQKFCDIFNKKTKKNMKISLDLIKKAEMLLRKRECLYLPTIQRFLLNMKRAFK